MFINQLIDATKAAPITVVFTCRADFFFDKVLQDHRLLETIHKDAQVFLRPMEEDKLRDVIEKPSSAVGLHFEDGLPERILEAMRLQPGHLPLLSFLLEKLWEKRKGPSLTNAAYRALGGVDGAVAKEAEKLFPDPLAADYESFDTLTERLFIQLVSAGKVGEEVGALAGVPISRPLRKPLAHLPARSSTVS